MSHPSPPIILTTLAISICWRCGYTVARQELCAVLMASASSAFWLYTPASDLEALLALVWTLSPAPDSASTFLPEKQDQFLARGQYLAKMCKKIEGFFAEIFSNIEH